MALKKQMFGLVGAVALASAALFVGPSAFAASFDGTWSVEVIPHEGSCDVYKWDVGVSDGRITQVEDNLLQASGGIDGRGHVNVILTRGSTELSATGELSNRTGHGRWKSASLNCSGEWRAEKRL
jgi:hypothetical protein